MSKPALRVVEGGALAPETSIYAHGPDGGRRLLVIGGLGLCASSIALEYTRATRGGELSDLTLATVIGFSITVIAGAMRRYRGALRAWLAAGTLHVIASLSAFGYFHLALFERHPVPLTRRQLVMMQGKALVGFVLIVGLICMIASAVRKATK